MREKEQDKTMWVHEAIETHQGSLIRYALSFLGDLEKARDVAQDTFLKLCEQDPEKISSHLRPWLFRVCRNRAIDILRKDKRMQPFHSGELEMKASLDPSPATQVETSETLKGVFQFLGTLPPNQREALRLKFQNDLSYKEISEILELSVSNVGFLLHQGMKALQKHFKKEESSSGQS